MTSPRAPIRIPRARPTHPAARLALGLWTFPTNALGHAVGRLWTRRAPERVGGRAASGWLYRLPPSNVARSLAAISFGSVILAEAEFVSGERGLLVLAHELSHTRQHDVLGPFYLPIHALFQLASVALSLLAPRPGFTPQHAHNPLERGALAVPFDALVDPSLVGKDGFSALMAAFGLDGPAGPTGPTIDAAAPRARTRAP